jgi:hypothetical protein
MSLLLEKGMAGAQEKVASLQRASRLDTEPNHYAVLGLQSSATLSDVRVAFR